MDRICRGGGRLDVLEESYELLKQLRAENARLREALKTLFEGRGLSYNAAGEASCNWCERWDKDGLGEEYIEHLSGCPFTALSPTAGMEE